MKKIFKNQKGFSVVELVIAIIIIAAIGIVGWRVVVWHNRNTGSSNSVSISSPSQRNCSNTKITYFPDNILSFQMPSCWQAGYFGTDIINSSNQYSAPNSCDVLPDGSTDDCPATVNNYDAFIYIAAKSAKGDNLQQWISSQISALPHPDQQMYVLTTFAGQPAECTNPNDPNDLGAKYSSIPPNLPAAIPEGIFISNCEIIWKNKAYSIGPVIQNDAYTDLQQVYSLLESIKFH